MREKQTTVLTLLLVILFLLSASTEAATRIRVGVGVSARFPVHRTVFTTHFRVGTPLHYHRFGFHGTRVIRVSPGNAGRVDFNVKPSASQVFVDGAFIGAADDYNGGFFGETATLKAGKHRIKVVSPDGQVVYREIYVMPGKKIDFNLTF